MLDWRKEENGKERKTEKGKKKDKKERRWVLKSEHCPVGEDNKLLEFVELTLEFYFFLKWSKKGFKILSKTRTNFWYSLKTRLI